jgi:rhodanese-related sulfurtransferase
MKKIKFQTSLFLFLGFFIFVGIVSYAAADNPIQEGKSSPITEFRQVGSGRGGSFYTIDIKTLAEMLTKKDFLFINVHIPYEGEIEKTDIFIPFNRIEQNLMKLPADKNAKIVLYCRTDRMSTIAAHTLVGAGYTNVWLVEGGMVKWKQEGYKLLHKDHSPVWK